MSVYRSFKQTERRIAKKLGGVRTGHLGGTDVIASWLAVECKHRKRLPDWLKDAVRQARRNAEADQLAVCVLHEHGARSDNDLVVLTLADWLDWFGDVSPVPAGGLDTVKSTLSRQG